ncbi:MAG TPA: DEAD/DEAH box helicase [Bacteriovoracaceae bacterium]|nr:DEAD/DEAH box helicase [Bacteriovoracaceae bacterium]
MEYTNKNPIDSLIEEHFTDAILFQAQKMVEQGRVSLSFTKGNPEGFFIVSGIISENNTSYEAKVSAKKSENKFNTQCSCHLWSEEQPCHHTASLLLKFAELKQSTSPTTQSSPFHYSMIGNEGVHVERYGTLVKDAPKLIGAKMNSSFSSLQYTLKNRKVINFPPPSRWEGKLKVNLFPAQELEEYKDSLYIEEKFAYRFSWLDNDGNETKEISLFDVLYLFNWETGIALDLQSEIRELNTKLKLTDLVADIQDFIRIFFPLHQQGQVELCIEDQPWDSFETNDLEWRFSINTSQRKSFLNLELELFTPDQKKVPIPSPFMLFISEGGWAGSFRTKNDSMSFFKSLIEDWENETTLHRKHIHSASKKALMSEWINLINTEMELHFFDPEFKKIFVLSVSTFKKVFQSFMKNFTEQSLKTSFYFKDERKALFQVPKTALLEGVAGFYYDLLPLNIPIFYDQEQIKTWKSGIRFERNLDRLDWFQLDLIVDDNDLEIIKNAEITDNFIISNKGLLLLSNEQKDLLRFMKRYTKFEGDKKEGPAKGLSRFGLFLQRARIFELFELKRLGIEGALTVEEEEFCQKIMNMESMPQYEVHERFKDIARPYQLEGYNWLRFLYEHKFGACLADDMGLGKTLQTIMLLQTLQPTLKRVLIVTPVSILFNWRNEIEKFSDLTYSVYYGDEREFKTDAQVILTSYGLMKKESLSTLSEEEYDIVIFDEVQHLKNVRSLGANSARQLKAKFRICLTGTPVENDLSEFYNIMDLAVPGVWGDLGILRSQSKNKNRLLARKTVKPFILRRTKEQVLQDLPEKIENHVFLDFSQEEKDFYKNKLDVVRANMMATGTQKRYGEVLKSLLQMRQLCLWQKQPSFYSTKVDFLMENLEQLVSEGHKTLVFSQFTTYLDMIENKIREQGWKFARIDGSQALKKRSEQVELFQNGDAQIFLISLKAGGFGLNLTAASYIFLMDPWWNPAVERQAIDRAHRIGQENKLTVYRPIIKDSIEEKVLILQKTKQELFRDLMAEDDENFFSGKLSMEDFQHLLS